MVGLGTTEAKKGERRSRSLAPYRGQDPEATHITFLTFYRQELGHMATPSCKGHWKIQSLAVSLCARLKLKEWSFKLNFN